MIKLSLIKANWLEEYNHVCALGRWQDQGGMKWRGWVEQWFRQENEVVKTRVLGYMWVSWPQTYLLAAGTWLLEPLDCPGDSDQQGQSQLLGGERQRWWEDSSRHPFLPPCRNHWLFTPPLLTYLGPRKEGHPPWEKPLWLQRLPGPPKSVGPVGRRLGWGAWLSAPQMPWLAHPGRPKVSFFALCVRLAVNL